MAEQSGGFEKIIIPTRPSPITQLLWGRISETTIRRLRILEPVLAFSAIMAYIWLFHYSHRQAWVAILGMLVLSHRLHGERADVLGFQVRNFGECWRDLAPAVAFLALLLLTAGILFQTTKRVSVDDAFFAWLAYVPWGLVQQYLLNSYFLNRFEAVASRRTALTLSAALFSGAHTPNWFLMAITFCAGYCCLRIYRRYRNLYFLGIAHGTVGFLLLAVVPDSISHHLAVGPGWFRHP